MSTLNRMVEMVVLLFSPSHPPKKHYNLVLFVLQALATYETIFSIRPPPGEKLHLAIYPLP